jgi:hypothetical protein
MVDLARAEVDRGGKWLGAAGRIFGNAFSRVGESSGHNYGVGEQSRVCRGAEGELIVVGADGTDSHAELFVGIYVDGVDCHNAVGIRLVEGGIRESWALAVERHTNLLNG